MKRISKSLEAREALSRAKKRRYAKKLIEWAEESLRQSPAMAGWKNITLAPSIYKKIINKKLVKINVPSFFDRHMKKIKAHNYLVPEDEMINRVNILKVPKHWRRGIMINGKLITQNFFINEVSFLGTSAVADVSIQSKINIKTEEVDIVINYSNFRKEAEADFIVTIGTPKGGEVPIPGTNKFIAFLPIRKRAEKISA